MVVRLHNLSKWRVLKAGDAIAFAGEQDRKVRIEVNCEFPTRFDVVHGDGDRTSVTFLAVVVGMETLEFTAPGETYLTATSDGEVWYFTNEGDQTATDRKAQSFTKVMNRRSRNPDLERMMFKMEQNTMRRLAMMAEEVEARISAAGAKHDTATGEVEEPDDADDTGHADGISAEPEGGDGGATGGGEAPADAGEKPAKRTAKAVSA